MRRRVVAAAASLLLAGGGFVAAAQPAAAVDGSFTIAGGHTRWSYDAGRPITITGTTNPAVPGPVSALVDGASSGSGTEAADGTFSLTFTLPDTTCADGEANTHQVGVALPDG